MIGESRRPRVTVSGSFRRSLAEIADAVDLLREAGADVLSPADPRQVGELDGFLFVASDRSRVISLLQQRHFAAIRSSDYLWVVAPEGRIGLPVGMEIGHALACNVPGYCSHQPADVTVRAMVRAAPSPVAPLMAGLRDNVEPIRPTFLDPAEAIDDGHRLLADSYARLSTWAPRAPAAACDPAVTRAANDLVQLFEGLCDGDRQRRTSVAQ
jgi:hypothetical protein